MKSISNIGKNLPGKISIGQLSLSGTGINLHVFCLDGVTSIASAGEMSSIAASGLVLYKTASNSGSGGESNSSSDKNIDAKGAGDRVYKPSPKHDPTSGWGSPDPIPDIKTGQELLDTAYSSSKTKQLYNYYDGKLVKFQPDTVNGWHSYEVVNPAKEVPADVLRQMLNDGKITKAQYKNFIKNK
ncbi:hypothetical protein [Clostridium lundense]|uniref:hypothetical protein n=1 Tax=Clostridium lundense TaxID=319475 RepID=UPI0006866628|nr:hypothetical protein [Clostridium lundense]